MEEIKNKRITREDIKQIASLLHEHYEKMKERHLQYKRETEDYNNPANKETKDMVVSSKPLISFKVATEGASEEKDDFEWFVDCLNKNAQILTKVHIYYSASFHSNCTNDSTFSGQRGEETYNISLYTDSILYSKQISNPSNEFEDIMYKIQNILWNAPVRYDDTIKKKMSRENFPSLVISLIGGIILTAVLFLTFKFAGLSIGIEKFVCSPFFAPVMLILSILIGVVIPGPNHSLYKRLHITQRYSGYNRNTRSDVYETDVKNIKDHCEVEIGENFNHGNIRTKIERNYKNALRNFWIVLAVFAVICIIFAFI